MPVVDQEPTSDASFNPVDNLQNTQDYVTRAHRSVTFAPDIIYPTDEYDRRSQTTNTTIEDQNDQNNPNEEEEENNSQNSENYQNDRSNPNEQEEQEDASSTTNEDGTGRRFKIPFEEHRLRFNQTFPPGLEMRIPESEFEIVLEQIHREFIDPVDVSQKAVRKWSAIVAGTAPIVIGFFLSVVLARRVHRHQKTVRNFWITLRNHLKTINKDIYYARGIEWRIERDTEKIEKREAYNKLYAFRVEIVFRKAIAVRSAREIALRSTLSPPRSRQNSHILNGRRSVAGTSFAESDLIADPELLALLSTLPAGENSEVTDLITSIENNHNIDDNSDDDNTNDNDNVTVGNDDNEDRTVYSSPFLVPDHLILKEGAEPVPEIDEDLLVKHEEPEDVKKARVSSIFGPPSITPKSTNFDVIPDFPIEAAAVEAGSSSNQESPVESHKMTFADLLRSTLDEKDEDKESSDKTEESPRTVNDLSKADEGSPIESLSTAATTTTSNSARKSREEAFAQRQRKKFSRTTALMSQLYDIPESPKLGENDDPTGDAVEFLNGDDDDLIEDILGVSGRTDDDSRLKEDFREKKLADLHGEEELPVAAYPMADPFASLYETDQVIPLDPIPDSERDDDQEYSEVDGDVEFVKRKKWRVDPERADKVSPLQRRSESIKPASRRSSFMPSAPPSSNMKFE